MAIVPMKQTILVTKPSTTDKFNRPISPAVITMNCRFEEKQSIVARASSSVGVNQSMSDEVKSTGRILLDKLVDIGYDDSIEYTNEFGITKTYTPLNITPKRNFGGKVILTVVDV